MFVYRLIQLPNGTQVLSGVVICSDAPDGYTA